MLTSRTLSEFAAVSVAEAAAWGDDGTGKHALAQAEQLKSRIAVGEALLAGAVQERRPAIERQLAQLRQARARALADPVDKRRCAAWRAAWERWDAAYFQVQLEIQDAS
jgi:hypothetical protein